MSNFLINPFLVAPPASAGVSFIGVESNSATTWTTNLPVNKPACPDGSLLVAVVCWPIVTLTMPSGWTLITTCADGGGTISAYWRYSTSGDPASWTFTLSGGRPISAAILAYGGVHASTPIDQTQNTGGVGTVAGNYYQQTASLTPTVTPSLLVAAFGSYSDQTPQSFTPPATMTERVDREGAAAPTNAVAIMVADEALVGTSAAGARRANLVKPPFGFLALSFNLRGP